MRLITLVLTGAIAVAGCSRKEAPTPAPGEAPAAAEATVQDLSTADATVTIVPVRPAFVRSVDLVRNGQAVAEGDTTLAKADRLELVLALQQAPGGLGIRYELIDASGKTAAEERKSVDGGATEARFAIGSGALKAGSYELHVWSGGDLVERRRLRWAED